MSHIRGWEQKSAYVPKPVKLYLSGPMSNQPDNNVREFAVHARNLRLKKFEVWNPAETEINVGQPWAHCLKNDIQHLLQCDGIAVMDGWQMSKGAKLEVYVALAVGMPVYDAATGHKIYLCSDEPYISSQETSAQISADDYLKTPQGMADVIGLAREYMGSEPTSHSQGVFQMHPHGVTKNNEPDEEEDILLEAQRVVNGPRRRDYDDPHTNHVRIAKMWSVIVEKEVTPEQVAMCMIALKLAREMHTQKRDNAVDIAGYASCLDFIRKAQKKEKSKDESIHPR